MKTNIQESTGNVAEQNGKLLVQVVTPGWGSSGYYSQEVLESAANDKIWPSGTHMFFDHPSESERMDRPERSVRDLAAVLTEDARWDGERLVAEARVIGPYKELVTDPTFLAAVGVSIRAAGVSEAGTAEGREGPIIQSIEEGYSVDLVTTPGRGGKVLALLESARVTVTETMTSDVRDLLNKAVGSDTYVIDFDPDQSTVIYRREWEDGEDYKTELLRNSYSLSEDGLTVTLGESPEPVRQVTTYLPVQTSVPVTESDPATVGQIKKENPMSDKELTEAVGRADAAEARNAELEAIIAATAQREKLTPVVSQLVSESGLPVRRQMRIVQETLKTITADTTEDQVKATATTMVTDEQAYVADIAESLGVGSVRHFGETRSDDTTSLEAFDEAFATKEN